jgi:hypothetical protein
MNKVAGSRNHTATPRTDTEVEGEELAIGGEVKDTQIIPKMWAVYGRTYSPCEKATEAMPAGHYLIKGKPRKRNLLC